jgi:MoxR-like ATPase
MCPLVQRLYAPESTPYRFIETARAIESEVSRVIVGQQEVVRGVLTCLLAGGHALLEGIPGLGKTLLVRTLGEVLELSFSRVQFTPDLMPADITGTSILRESTDGARTLEFQPGRCSPTWCSPMKSTGPRRRHNPPCSKRCRSAAA